ncbi:MAG: hypothetical protein J7501_15995 [Bdellovibrio sp.]|nr:hypothetical protein [Bdellovibrio sp.]
MRNRKTGEELSITKLIQGIDGSVIDIQSKIESGRRKVDLLFFFVCGLAISGLAALVWAFFSTKRW